MKRLFLSYARAAQADVKALAGDLRDMGHEVWFDQELLGGTPWWSVILGHIRDCDAFIYVVTPDSATSLACRRELEYAVALGLPIVPVQVQPCDLAPHPQPVKSVHVIAYVAAGKLEAMTLSRALNALAPRPPLPEPLPPPPEPPVHPVDELREQATQDGTMSLEAQSLWVLRARAALQAGENRAGLLQALAAFRGRRELYQVVANDLRALEEAAPEPPAAAPPPPPTSSPPPAPAPAPRAKAKPPRPPREARSATEPAAPPPAPPAPAPAAPSATPARASLAPQAAWPLRPAASGADPGGARRPLVRPPRQRGLEYAAATLPGLLLAGVAAWLGPVRPIWVPAALLQWQNDLSFSWHMVLVGLALLVIVVAAYYFVSEELVVNTWDALWAAGKAAVLAGVALYSFVGSGGGLHWPVVVSVVAATHWVAIWYCLWADV